MTATEFGIIADRMSLLWPPAMTAAQVDAYWQVLQKLQAMAVDKALTLIARTPREFRPTAGLIYETSNHQQFPALPPANKDVLTDEEHRYVMAQLTHVMSAEHRRRHAAVLALPTRLSLKQLQTLMSERFCPPEEFDRWIALKREELYAGVASQ